MSAFRLTLSFLSVAVLVYCSGMVPRNCCYKQTRSGGTGQGREQDDGEAGIVQHYLLHIAPGVAEHAGEVAARVAVRGGIPRRDGSSEISDLNTNICFF